MKLAIKTLSKKCKNGYQMLDKERNTKIAKEVCEKHNPLMPSGLTIYFTKESFGISYRHPEGDRSANTGIQVGFNLSAIEFDRDANNACEAMYKLAKATNRKFGVDSQKSSSIIECERTMVDGKCQCGYSAKASESAQAIRKVVEKGYHTAYMQKPVKSRINDDGDIIW